jgi:hypothetical protein
LSYFWAAAEEDRGDEGEGGGFGHGARGICNERVSDAVQGVLVEDAVVAGVDLAVEDDR